MKKCRYLHGDWCHHPDFVDEQELCSFYFDQENCPSYKAIEKHEVMNGE